MGTKSFVMVLMALSVAVSGCTSQDSEDKVLEVPVGTDAWGNEKTVNVTGQLDPSEIRLNRNETVVWRNKNKFNITVSITGANKDFTVLPDGRQSFKPSSDFNYRVSSENGRIGTGKVVVN